MGRTLHYGIENDYHPTDADQLLLLKLSTVYNSKFEWTCENVNFFELDYYPNWKYWRSRKKSNQEIWSTIDDRYDMFVEQGMNPIEVVRSMHRAGWILFLHEGDWRFFTKVRGNEMNAHLVIRFVLDASRLLPSAILCLHDEGDALYCPVLIQSGKMKPDLSDMRKSLNYWVDKDYLQNGGTWDVSAKEHYFRQLIKLNPDLGDPTQYIRPIKEGSVFNERQPSGTVEMSLNEIEDLPHMITALLMNEHEESSAYYENVKSYPV